MTNDSRINRIKSVRALTRILGKLSISCCVVDYDAQIGYITSQGFNFPRSRPPWPSGKSYGWGLKESKDWVDRYLDRKA